MIRPLRLFATLAATIALALGVTARLVRAEPDAAPPAIAYRGAAPASARVDDSGEYRLDRLPILSRVILSVKDNYVDPARFEPKQMVVSALESVEKTVAEVMVQGDAKSPKLTLTVGEAQRELDISGVDSIWKIRTVLGEAMGFIQEHLVAHKELKEIEYAAVNGMLSTLDPHTVLLEPKYFKEMKLQTRGEFGGIGFVIQMRDGNLTVVRVIKDSPAQRAGIKPKDVIQKIEEQSTINMDLQDAVDRLRGKPQTRVAITIMRAGFAEPQAAEPRPRGDQGRDRPAGAAPRGERRLREALAVLGQHHARALEGAAGPARPGPAASSRGSSSTCAATRAACSSRRSRSPTSSSPTASS